MNELGISVGIKFGNTINWYQAHSLNRRNDGAMVVFARDEKRTIFVIPGRNFAGVCPGLRETFSGNLHPCILESEETQQYKGD